MSVGAVRRSCVYLVGTILTAGATGQTCTSMAKLPEDQKSVLTARALELAEAVRSNDGSKVQALTVAQYAADFSQTAYTLRNLAPKLTGDAFQVAQLYLIDASGRKTGDTSNADFSCALQGTTAETDFSIGALPPGQFAFAMVEGSGGRAFLLAFLLQKEAGQWKMAGFFPRARTAAGKNGVTYWTQARDDAKAKELWRSWLLYGEADDLLRPANFVTSTNLDKLRSEQRASAPPELADGISATAPLVIKGGGAQEFRFTAISAEGSDDGQRLNLMLHYDADPLADPAAATARNIAAAKALLDAHKGLRKSFDGVWMFAESPGHTAFATEKPITAIP